LNPESKDKLDVFFSLFGGGGRPHLLLDYDGTLASFRVDRFQSRPWAGVRELLTRIQRQGRTRMAVISGRPAQEIAPMLGLDPPLEAWGLHGAERICPDGRRELELAPATAQTKLDELRARLKHDSLGGLYEDKANGAVIHWRGYSPQRTKLIEERARALFAPLAKMEGLTLLDFDGGLELRAGRNKGGAVEAILAETGEELAVASPVAYLGDDLSDEAAFRAVNKRINGLSILVRRTERETAARLWLRPPTELRDFLERWAESLARYDRAKDGGIYGGVSQ
jgi:trehalose 6-phosphate phosphatase